MQDYTGLGAIAWDVFSGEEPGTDYHYFKGLVKRDPGLILDVGCGTGRILIPFLEAGLQVEGVEPSEDMLAICRQKAAAKVLSPVLYRQTMQALDLPSSYSTILVPCGSIQLVMDRSEAAKALRGFYEYLDEGGSLVLTVYNQWEEMEQEKLGEWKFRARQALSDGTQIAKHAMVEGRCLIEQTLDVVVRYQRLRGGHVVEEQLVRAGALVLQARDVADAREGGIQGRTGGRATTRLSLRVTSTTS